VLPNTPAAKAGIKPDDIIVAFNGKDIPDAHSLTLAVSQCEPGSSATVKLVRDGVQKDFTVALGELPSQRGAGMNGSGGSDSDVSRTDALDGVTVQDLDRETRQELKIPDSVEGAMVTDVDQNSNSAEAGLQRGDVIVQINRQQVTDADSAVKLGDQSKSDQILLKIWRRNGNFSGMTYLTVDNTKKK